MIVTSGVFSGVGYQVEASELNSEIVNVSYQNPTKTRRKMCIAATGIEWTGVLEPESNGMLPVDSGIPAMTCSVSLS